MNTLSPAPSVEQQVRCWCGNAHLEDFSPDYGRCPECQTLVLREMRGEEISRVSDDEHDFYGKNYYLRHLQEEHGYPDLETRARADLPERCLHWLRTLLKFVSGPGASTLELGCGHGGFVAMQRWAGLDATGLELSPWLVGRARALFGVPVLEGRLEDQGLAPGSLDAVVLMDVLEHLPDPRRTLGRAVSLLRGPESFLLVQTPCYPEGVSYEALLAQDHPFLQQLKPSEHLYLFSKRAVARLCSELGVGEVRFEPAIFAHYDLFAVASAGPVRERPHPEQAPLLLAARPPARQALALLDLDAARDALTSRMAEATAELWPRVEASENARNLLAAQLADMRGQFTDLEADHAARLAVIERQGVEISRLHAEVDGHLQTAREFWPMLDTAVNERNLLAAQIADLTAHFERGEADLTARLQIIERQGAEIARLHAEVDHWLRVAGELRPPLEAARHECNLRAAELADLRTHFERSEADRDERSRVIDSQGAEIARLHAEVDHWLRVAGELRPPLEAARHECNLRAAELADLRGHFEHGEADRAARLEIIENQGAELGVLHAQLSLARSELSALHAHYKASEADRAARLAVIEDQGAANGRLHAQLAGAEAVSVRLAAELEKIQKSHAALASELETARAEQQTLKNHWTARTLKKIGLWPL